MPDASASDAAPPDSAVVDAASPDAQSDGGAPDAAADAGAPVVVYLSDLAWTATHRVADGPYLDVSGYNPHIPPPNGGFAPITIDGVVYAKGVAWFSQWNESWVEWDLGGAYSRFKAVVRIDDYERNAGRVNSEWACVDSATDTYLFLCRPPGYQTATESLCANPGTCAVTCVNNNPAEPTCAYDNIRVGAGGRVQILGDGVVLHTTAEFYAFGTPVQVDEDVTGVSTLRIRFIADHTEQPNAPYRNGLTTPVTVDRVGWFDLVDLADARLEQ